jgi:hypothetical protein
VSETIISDSNFDESFPHRWQAEVLPARPAILPARHFVYPRRAEEVERGALEVLVRPEMVVAPSFSQSHREKGGKAQPSTSFSQSSTKMGAPGPSHLGTGEGTSHSLRTQITQPFLATCALGFRDPAVPTGLWSTPKPEEICAVAGGYAYLIDTAAPERFTMIPYRPVLRLMPALEAGLLLFVGHRSILAWGSGGQAWESEKLSDEGVTIVSIEGSVLRGSGWQLLTDKETPFALDLRTGQRQT